MEKLIRNSSSFIVFLSDAGHFLKTFLGICNSYQACQDPNSTCHQPSDYLLPQKWLVYN